MQATTLKIVTLMFCFAFVVTWVVISISMTAMYEPPTSIQLFIGALISGKYLDGRWPRPGHKVTTEAS